MREAIDGATLTSYALGELSTAERAAVEARLAESEALRNELREIEKTAAMLRQAFALAPQHALSGEQRSAIEAEALRPRPLPFPARRTWLTVGLAAAAALILALGTWVVVGGGRGKPQPADRDTPDRIGVAAHRPPDRHSGRSRHRRVVADAATPAPTEHARGAAPPARPLPVAAAGHRRADARSEAPPATRPARCVPGAKVTLTNEYDRRHPHGRHQRRGQSTPSRTSRSAPTRSRSTSLASRQRSSGASRRTSATCASRT